MTKLSTRVFDDTARMITTPTPLGQDAVFRTEFVVRPGFRSARVLATALGVFELTLNELRVSDEYLNPGWTSYHHRLQAASWDVTDHVRPGHNVLEGAVGDGWYRGRLAWKGESAHYGDRLGLLAQLELEYADGVELVVTDRTWLAGPDAGRTSSLYDGSTADLTAHPVEPRPADELEFDTAIVQPRLGPAVREFARIPMSPRRSVLDAGQNLVGWVELTVDGRAGDVIEVRHAELLDAGGGLHTAPLRSARATDRYVLARDGRTTLAPRFTFHGFRYAQVTGAEVVGADAVAVSSATIPTSAFECSLPELNRLHANTVWSQRGNFVSIPTDCPQRDERLGWTGDAQVFAPTACILFESEAFWTSWLTDLALDQREDGSVPSVVPDILQPGDVEVGEGAESGRAGWADAATLVPWAVYRAYGNDEVLRRQLPSMRAWVDHLVRRGGGGLLPEEFQFGDWLDPDAPGDQPSRAKCPAGFLANAFFARSAAVLADTEDLVGEPANANRYRALSQRIAAQTWERWAQAAVGTQTGCAISLVFGIAPESERSTVAEELATLVDQADGRIGTGFLGTPHVLFALSDSGHVDQAYRMLLRREAPSWLYQVERGATTIWERWDAILPDGSIHSGAMADDVEGMLSFNHYAYGAVTEWLYRAVAGIGMSADDAGYRSVDVAPRPHRDVTWARAHIDTRLGRLAIDWVVEGDELRIDATIPEGSRARLDLPVTERSVVRVDGERSDARALRPGRHTLVVTHPRVAGVPVS